MDPEKIENLGNLVYLPGPLKAFLGVTLTLSLFFGVYILIDSIYFKSLLINVDTSVSYLQVSTPLFFAYVVVAFGRRRMSSARIAAKISRYISTNLRDAIDRTHVSVRYAALDNSDILVVRNIYLTDAVGAEYELCYGGIKSFVRVWYDLTQFTVLLRMKTSSNEEFLGLINEKFRHWTKRFTSKGWSIDARESWLTGEEDQAEETDQATRLGEIWCIKHTSNNFIYDSFEQAKFCYEISSLIRSFFEECKRHGCLIEVDADWIEKNYRKLVLRRRFNQLRSRVSWKV